MDLKIEKLKGFRDFLPEDMKIRNYVKEVIVEKFKLWGFEEILTPTVEYSDLFTLKSGEEITESMFVFKDKGNRNVCLKPEQTASTVRFFVENFKNFAFPLKFFYFCPVFRYDEPQHARYREFWHLGVELIGSSTPETDAEVISLAYRGLKALNLNFVLEISNIKVIKGVLNSTNLTEEDKKKVLHCIDKHNVTGTNEILKGVDKGEILNQILSFKGKSENLSEVKDILKKCKESVEGIEELENVAKFMDVHGINYVINFWIVRGLDYYTSLVFEAHANDMQICGGGRYNDLISMLSEGNKSVPAVGFAYGFDRVINALEMQNLIPKFEGRKILIIVTDEKFKIYAIDVVDKLRGNGIRAEIELMNRKLIKAMDYANKQDYKYTIIIGEKEEKERGISLKNMVTGEQKFLSVDEIEEIKLITS